MLQKGMYKSDTSLFPRELKGLIMNEWSTFDSLFFLSSEFFGVVIRQKKCTGSEISAIWLVCFVILFNVGWKTSFSFFLLQMIGAYSCKLQIKIYIQVCCYFPFKEVLFGTVWATCSLENYLRISSWWRRSIIHVLKRLDSLCTKHFRVYNCTSYSMLMP